MGKKQKIISIIIISVLLIGVVAACVIDLLPKKAAEVDAGWAQQFVNEQFDSMAEKSKPNMKHIAQNNSIVVNNVSYGSQRDIILDCSITTIDAYGALHEHYGEFLGTTAKKKTGLGEKSATDLEIEFEDRMLEYLENAQVKTVDAQIMLYETDNGVRAYFSKDAINAVFGGILSVKDDVDALEWVTVTDEAGNETQKEIEAKNIKLGFVNCISVKYEPPMPETAGWFGRIVNTVKKEIQRNLIEHDRWKTIFSGLWVTLKLTFCSAVIGIILGFLVAFIRCTYLARSKRGIFLTVGNAISQTYLTIIRGTPAVVQIMIIYFVIFMPIGVEKFPAAVICFGINSGAYVAEIVRGGIMSVDAGQTEAGRSLGFGYMQTMWHIVFPQAFKAVLPSLANEFVVLLKETSVAFYIGLGDLMYAGNAIRAATYSPYTASIVVALIYFVMVLILSKLVGLLERRLRNSER